MVEKMRNAQNAGVADGLLKKTAQAIGAAVGIAAAKTGIAHPQAVRGPRIVNGKYQKNHKHRLPRKVKKLGNKGTAQGAGN